MVCPNVLGICFGAIVYIGSLKYPGHWMDAHDKNSYVYFTKASVHNLIKNPDTLWPKWYLRDGGNGAVMLESARYANHYLDASHNSYVYVTYSDDAVNDDWTKWKLTREGGSYFLESARSWRYQGYYLQTYSGWFSYYAYLHYGKDDDSVKMRVYRPCLAQ